MTAFAQLTTWTVYNGDQSGNSPAYDDTLAVVLATNKLSLAHTALSYHEWMEVLTSRPELLPEEARGRFAFSPADLQRAGTLSLPASVGSSTGILLCGTVHPIFGLDKFTNLHDNHFRRFTMTTFRLATLFLMHPSCTLYFQNALFATRQRSWATDAYGKRYAVPRQIEFRVETEGRLTAHRTYATTEIDYESDAENAPFKIIVFLNPDFIIAGRTLMSAQTPDMAACMRYWFFFALTLAHEICHAVELYRDPNGRDPLWTKDKDWHTAEAGATFEHFLFGGKVNPVNDSCDCKYGLSTFSYADPLRQWKVYQSVPMAIIAELLQEETWSFDFKTGYRGKEHWWLPGNGGQAESVYLAKAFGANLADVFE